MELIELLKKIGKIVYYFNLLQNFEIYKLGINIKNLY